MAKQNKKSAAEVCPMPVEKKKKSMKKKTAKTGTFKTYIKRMNNKVNPNLQLSSSALQVINDMMVHVLEDLGLESKKLLQKTRKRTLQLQDMQAALQLKVSPELVKLMNVRMAQKHAGAKQKKPPTQPDDCTC